MKGVRAVPLLASSVAFGLRRLGHNVRYLVFAVVMPVGFYLLYSQIYGRYSIDHTSLAAYLMISMAAFGAVGTTLNAAGTQTALDRDAGWVRSLRLTPLPPWTYVATQVAVAMVASLCVVALVVAVAVTTQGLAFSAVYAEAALAVWLGSLAFAAIGLTVAYLLDASTVTYAIMITYLGLSLLGGLWIPLSELPHWFTVVARFDPSYRMADIAWRLLAGQAVPGLDLLVLAAYVAGFGALAGYLYRARG
jgi:ABC-2 type transport system permease protein